MHMADALIAPVVAGGMYLCSSAAAGYSIRSVQKEDLKKIPVMGVMGAFVFAAQMINFTIPGTGASGHLCGGMLLSAVLGPQAGFLTMAGILLVQCLLFADGGLLALGCNIWNMAFYGCFIGAAIIWRLMMRNGITKNKITIASIAGCILTLQLGAFSVVLQTTASQITELPFQLFVSVMQPIHLAIGLVEGMITAAVLIFLYEARPQLLYCSGNNHSNVGSLHMQPQAIGGTKAADRSKVNKSAKHRILSKTVQKADAEKQSNITDITPYIVEDYAPKKAVKNRLSMKHLLIILALAATAAGCLVSLYASSNPDGLEWSIERVAGEEVLQTEGAIYDAAESIQSQTAVLPDYSAPHVSETAGTSISGLIGGIVVMGLCICIGIALRQLRNRRLHE